MDSAPLPDSNHEAFELFLRETDRGVLTRTEATDAVAALTAIAAGSTPSLLPLADRAVRELAARDAVLAAVADGEIAVGLDVEGCVAESVGQARQIVRVAIGPSDIGWIASSYRHQIATAGLGDASALIGHFLVIRTPSGERMVREYESGLALQDAWINSIAVARGRDHLS
ncbi:hypothetical protein ACQ7HM_20150 [Williamsia sp. MIQD14]|uniref:hypothetical protein n=1 Tax=Williamsia sp. MIQD14 TaxID=3425703 RepID=UPI003D9FDDCB